MVAINMGPFRSKFGESTGVGQRRYLTLDESAQVLDKPVSWLRKRIWRGQLSAKWSGGQWLISIADLRKFDPDVPLEEAIRDFLADRPIEKKPQPTARATRTAVLSGSVEGRALETLASHCEGR
jgi:hypothetical protein